MLRRFLESLFDCREEILGNAAAEYSLLKQQLVAVIRLKLYLDMSVLSVTAGLLLVLALDRHLLAYCLAVSDLRLGHHDVHSELGL